MQIFIAGRSAGAAKILTYTATGSAVAALLCAALNLIELAGYFVAGAVAVLAFRLLLLLYLHLPEADRSAVLSRRVLRRAGVISLILAVGVSCTYWYAIWWLPPDRVPPAIRRALADHWRKLDFVPALFAQLLPASWQSGFHQYFRGGWTYCFPGPYWWESMRYLRAAVPGYFVVFLSGVLLVRLGAASWRRLLRPVPFVLLLFMADSVDACQCGSRRTPAEGLRASQAVFEGRVIGRRMVLAQEHGWLFPVPEYELSVSRS